MIIQFGTNHGVGDVDKMTTIQDQNTCNCPVCDSEILIKKLASFGLTVDEFTILKKHRDNETLGTCLQLVDILMQKIEPGKLSTETEVQNKIMQSFMN